MTSMPANSIGDYNNRLARLRAVPILIEQTLALLERGLSTGITPPRITLRDVPRQVRNLATPDNCHAGFEAHRETDGASRRRPPGHLRARDRLPRKQATHRQLTRNFTL